MASIGSAQLTIVPKFDNLGASIEKALGEAGVKVANAGKKTGQDYSSGFEKGTSGLIKSGAVIGAFSAVTNKAMDLISSSVGGAVSRLDTLNNYPKVMQSLGYSAEESQASIAKMSERLTGLPTALNDMTSVVQGIVAITGDLDLATDAGLALNNMLLASGSSTAVTTAAMEQFRQMLSKGKPEAQEWKSLVSAAPGQMNQLAESMLGAGATANDLYTALGGGGADATITMDQLLQKMIELDTTGGESFASFEEQARNATGGIATSFTTMETAIARGMASVLESIGTDTIQEATAGIGKAFETGLKVVGDVIGAVIPHVKSLAGFLGDIAPAAIPAAAGIAGLAVAGKGLTGLSSIVSGLGSSVGVFKGIAHGASESLLTLAGSMKNGSKASEGLFKASVGLGGAMGGPLVLGITAAVAVAGLLVGAYSEAKKRSENFEKATKGLSDAVGRATALDDYAGKIENIGSVSTITAMSVNELAEANAAHAEKINEITSSAETEISKLNSAQQIISEYTGATDISSEAQGRLEWALKLVNEQFGLTLSATDVANGAYTDTEGNVVNLKDKIYDLIEAKKLEIRTMALTDSLEEAWKAEENAATTRADAMVKQQQALDDYNEAMAATGPFAADWQMSAARHLDSANRTLSEAEIAYNDAAGSVENLSKELGDAEVSASESADAYDIWGNKVGMAFEKLLERSDTSLSGLKEDLRLLGADTETLSTLEQSELDKIARAYNGTAQSITGVLGELGVEMKEGAADIAKNAHDIEVALQMMGGNTIAALEDIDLSNFSKKLADAGISAEELNRMGSENLAQLAANCNGDINSMVSMIEVYNSAPLIDKDGVVNVEDSKLVDAQGNVYTWNEGILVDKNGVAAVDDISLVDSQDNVWVWNDTTLTSKDSVAVVTGNAADGSAEGKVINANVAIRALNDKDTRVQVNGNYVEAGSSIWNLGSAISNLASRSIDIVTNFFTNGSRPHATGGIRLNAEGGYRFHAGGAIATKATPLDIVGDDGAEAIVPLTNKRYSLPFAKTLAEQMGGTGDSYSIGNITVTPDSTIARILNELFTELNRHKNMGTA